MTLSGTTTSYVLMAQPSMLSLDARGIHRRKASATEGYAAVPLHRTLAKTAVTHSLGALEEVQSSARMRDALRVCGHSALLFLLGLAQD